MRPFAKDPGLVVRREQPFNGGPPLADLCRSFLTPVDRFFVRNHGDVPEVDAASWRLEVGGLAGRGLVLSLDELRRDFPTVERTAALQCAGNRRIEMAAVRPIPGELPWGEEAVSNALWTGVPLAAVVDAAEPHGEARHVELLGLDRVTKGGETVAFGASIPLDKARGEEVLLAWAMNGEPLPPVHGAPLRAVVPGYVGARSVKWLERVVLRADPSDNFFQRRSYRLFPPGEDGTTADWESAPALGEFPVQAVICDPADGADLAAGRVRVTGYALAGGGRRVVRVDLTADGGATWRQAELGEGDGWTWRLWQAELELPAGRCELAVRAWDEAGHTQPETVGPLWNFKGYFSSAWHRVTVQAL